MRTVVIVLVLAAEVRMRMREGCGGVQRGEGTYLRPRPAELLKIMMMVRPGIGRKKRGKKVMAEGASYRTENIPELGA